MKIVIAFAAILAAMIGYWMWSYEPPANIPAVAVTPEVGANRVEDRLLSSTSPQPEPAVPSTRDSRASVPTATERLNVAKAIVSDLRGQKLLRTLREDPRLEGLEAEVLLALIEDGSIDINESLAGTRSNIPEFTPISVALLATDRTLSVANFDRFIELGARVESNSIWQSRMASVKDKALLERWYQAANVGPEQHQQMFNKALPAGNSVFIDFVLEDKGGKFDRLNFTGDYTESLKNGLITHESYGFKRVVSVWNQAQEESQNEHRAEFEKMINDNYAMLLRQVDLLLTYAELTSEEKEEIIATRAALENEVKELEKLFASAEE